MGDQIRLLIISNFKTELRQQYALGGILLYLISTIFITYLSFGAGGLAPLTWNTLFWIIILFTATNAIARSFLQEGPGKMLYYYALVSPQAFILAKIIFNTVYMLILAFTGLGLYWVVFGSFIADWPAFLLNLALASLGFSVALTLISAIAAKAGNSATLMAVLGFPVILPMLLIIIRISKHTIDGLDWSIIIGDIGVLAAINLLLFSASLLLFPYLWRS